MKPLGLEAYTWLEFLDWAEWYCVEHVKDLRSLSRGSPGFLYRPFDAERALRTINRIKATNAETQIVKSLGTSFKKKPRLEAFCRLMASVDLAYSAFARTAITQTERKRKARAIANAARILATELAHPAASSNLLHAKWTLARETGASMIDLRYSDDPQGYHAMAIVAERMADLPRIQGNPNVPNAHKLYVLRRITDYMLSLYGKPKRSLVLALTGLYFDVSDMTTNDLAKYAPGKKDDARRDIPSPPEMR